ncbi:trypsin-like peptidase domain-containing protein [Actinoplanes regularis]|uniref:trypsin-like peptidase domain-containing protein n=1 Tax=Actinoplanes regularis TaxID=52697 RepID=UPI0011783CDD|nr:trypsin-like peptidase domain-containing protein [Actinoplanes regularis]GIE85842.1 hypothetical protein Are01nite_23220 [Actinoplanes regularis]
MSADVVTADPGTVPGVVARQIAEVLVVTQRSTRRRGSGYRVAAGAVLTAAHVIDGASTVRVRFDADLPTEWSAEVASWWADPASDLAVLTIAPRESEPPVVRPRFGGIGAERAAVLAVRAVGFPRFKVRHGEEPPGRYRDSHQADGSVAVLSNRRERTLEVTVTPPEADPDPGVSPWEGMSGAALWAGERIVGVVAKHHRSDGLGRLAAVRLDLALAGADPDRRAELAALLDLGGGELPDVLVPTADTTVLRAYCAQVRDIAPDRLLDRDSELEELVRFCAADLPYAWWQAGPWAGKSALMAWFALHPPSGIDVVSFFVTGRLAGQSSGDAFVTALIEQLAALLHQPAAGLISAGARTGVMLQLLEDAAARARQHGRGLLLVIDGLDEDTGAAGTASIASLLPRRPPAGVHVLVAGRPRPVLPEDVPADHPLRTVRARDLSRSPHAGAIERRAGLELGTLLTGPRFQRDLLGLLAASGGGLTVRDLAELTGEPEYDISQQVDRAFGRSVSAWVGASVAGYPDEPVFVYAHDTLREVAEQHIGAAGLGAYRGRLGSWADTYEQSGWPPHTPRYLLRGYVQVLAAEPDLGRLARYASDSARHRRMRTVTGGDLLGLTEIRTAQQVLPARRGPDLIALTSVALERDDLTDRSTSVRPELAAVWTLIDQRARAEGFTAGIQDESTRRDALLMLIGAHASLGNHDDVVRLAADVEAYCGDWYPVAKAHALARLVRAITGIESARTITDRLVDDLVALAGKVGRRDQDRVLASVAEAIAYGGDPARAELVMSGIRDEKEQADARTGIVRAMAVRGDTAYAVRVARDADRQIDRLVDSFDRNWRRLQLVSAVNESGDTAAAEAIAVRIDDPGYRASALARTAAAATDRERAVHLVVEAQRLVEEADMVSARAAAPADVVKALLACGDHEGAARSSREAEALVEWSMGGDRYLVDSFIDGLAKAWSANRHYDQAETLARRLPDRYGQRLGALAELAHAAALAGDHARAARLADEVDANWGRRPADYRVVAPLAEALATAGDHPRALQVLPHAEWLARQATENFDRPEAIDRLMDAGNICHAYEGVRQLAGEMEDLIGERTRSERARHLAHLAEVHAVTGDRKRVLRLIGKGERSAREDQYFDEGRADLLARLAAVAVGCGERALAARLADEAASFLERICFPSSREEALATVGVAVATGGDLERGEALLRGLTDREQWVQHMTTLVDISARQGDRARGLRLATETEARIHQLDRLIPDGWTTTPQLRARALTALAGAVAATGDTARAARLADSAERYISKIGIGSRASHMGSLARTVAAYGDRVRAKRLARRAGKLSKKKAAWAPWADLAGVEAFEGDIDRAEALAVKVKGRWSVNLPRAHALAAVAEIVATTGGDPGRVERLAAEAVSLALQDRIGAAPGTLFAHLITLLAGAGAKDSAIRLAERAEQLLLQADSAGDQMRGLAQLARAVAATGDVERCLRLVGQVETVSRQDDMLIWRAEAMGELIEALTTIGFQDHAARLIDQTVDAIEHSDHLEFQALAQSSLVRTAIAIGRPDLAALLTPRALELITRIPYPKERDSSLANLVLTDATLGRFERAEHHAGLITKLPERAEALARIARHLTTTGDDSRADSFAGRCESVLARIDDPQVRARTTMAVLRTLAPFGPVRVRRLLAEAEGLVENADARPGIVESLVTELANTTAWLAMTMPSPAGARTSDAELTARARRHLATALTTSSWWDAITGLAQVEPSAITTIADRLAARWGVTY